MVIMSDFLTQRNKVLFFGFNDTFSQENNRNAMVHSQTTILKVTLTALWSEASVTRWSTRTHFQMVDTDSCWKT